mgnify:FL=1
MDKKISLEELHKRAYQSIDKTDNFNNGDFEDIPEQKYEYEEYENFQLELIEKAEGKSKIEIDEYEPLEKILQNKAQYRNARIAEKLYQQAIKEKGLNK